MFLEKKQSGTVVILIACVILIGLAIFSMVCSAGIVSDRTGVEKQDNGGSSSFGAACGIPAVYQKIFDSASSGPGGGKIPAALIAATFLVEHGVVENYESGYTPTNPRNSRWPEENGNPNSITKWESSSAGAQGPMQFMPSTWSSYGQGGNIQNITDAANGAARMDKANYDAASGTSDEKLKKAVARYNPGAGPWNNSWYVDKVWAQYQSLSCGGSFIAGNCPRIQTIDQLVAGWCGVASAAQNIVFWKGNYPYYSSRSYMNTWGSRISQSRLNKESGKNYQFTNDVNKVIASLKSGKPVIAYTRLYGSQHIIVLTCFDESTQTFTANDSEPRGRGGQQSVQRIGGVPLTVSNLTGPYNGSAIYNHPEFLVIN